MAATTGAAWMLAALEAAWETIRERHPEVPAVVMTLGSGTIGVKAGTIRLGHFAAARWNAVGGDGQGAMAEIFVAGEGLRGPIDPEDGPVLEADRSAAPEQFRRVFRPRHPSASNCPQRSSAGNE